MNFYIFEKLMSRPCLKTFDLHNTKMNEKTQRLKTVQLFILFTFMIFILVFGTEFVSFIQSLLLSGDWEELLRSQNKKFQLDV
jgi:hypothetical protein